MKFLIFLLASLGIETLTPSSMRTKEHFTFSEKRFIANVVRVSGKQPAEVYRLPNGKIAVNYPDQRLVLGQDGYIHDMEVLEGGEWIDLGPEY